MSQKICDFVPSSCELLALGEPTHKEPGFASIRNELFVELVDRGFRSVALETDRVAALAVDEFVRGGDGVLDEVMRTGFSHDFGELTGNRELVAWLRDYNKGRTAEDQVGFHGFDAAMETMSAPSPRTYLEFARDYLELDFDIAGPAGSDERWSRSEAVLDAKMSPGATEEAEQLRAMGDDMLALLYTRAPERIAATSLHEWQRATIHLTAGLGLLRYHRQAAAPTEDGVRWNSLAASRDTLMAQNLLDIRSLEARRGPTLVHSHNLHLRRNTSTMDMGPMELVWSGAGAIVGALMGERYQVVLGSLGRSDGLELAEPAPGTYENTLQNRIDTWGLVPAAELEPGLIRIDVTQEQGYFPLDADTIAGADAILHLNAGTCQAAESRTSSSR
ncbi:erythromycin esterase family protein [Nocardia sp. NPDC058640]|uniref:erythromycin esterase family protein n=1 Tax=Nocardia sp. NPDC058640 TaxID=3346571 RepID=UPI0036493B9A